MPIFRYLGAFKLNIGLFKHTGSTGKSAKMLKTYPKFEHWSGING
jgi:hypothetical protein